jgi:hypothetical protein
MSAISDTPANDGAEATFERVVLRVSGTDMKGSGATEQVVFTV